VKFFLRPILSSVFLVLALPLHAEATSKVISTAVQRSGGIFVYNDKGSIIATLNRGSGPKDGLVGYTGSTVSVRRGSSIYVYNANGHMISIVNAGH
jgi:hypothetical protein